MKQLLGSMIAAFVFFGGAAVYGQQHVHEQKTKGRVCGDPTVHCRTSVKFDAWDLPFEVPRNGVVWESERFYVVILKSVPQTADCSTFVPEPERLAAQSRFPHNKVFTSRCGDHDNPYFGNTAPDRMFMAVFAGRTRAEAQRVLAKVKAAGGFPGANVRRITTGFNGT